MSSYCYYYYYNYSNSLHPKRAKYTGGENNQGWWRISEGCWGNFPPLYMLKDPLLPILLIEPSNDILGF